MCAESWLPYAEKGSDVWAWFALSAVVLLSTDVDAHARSGYRSVRNGTVSLSTAAQPGSKCVAKQIDDNAVQTPNLWGRMGVFSGTLYEREQDGELVYSTRKLTGSRVYLKFTVRTPPGERAHAGLGKVGRPQLDRYAKLFEEIGRAHV